MDINGMTLQQAIQHFSDPDNCVKYMVQQRWPDGVVSCPTCGRKDVSWLAVQRKWQCKSKHAKRQFSAKVGTIFEDSPLGLDKWILATWMITNCKNGVSSYEIARNIGITQKSAWFMLHRIRLAMRDENPKCSMGQSGKPVEVDETYIGGKAKNKHLSARKQDEKKMTVFGMLDRSSREVRAKVVPNAKRETLQTEILKNIVKVGTVYSDGHIGYDNLTQLKYIHETVNHVNEYVRGTVHTQGIENFWSLLKRTLTGTYVAVEPFHLDAYVDEQVFRFNNRKGMNDEKRFAKVLSQVAGKRLTLAELTGKVGQTAF
jgi:transposase-like protein